MSPSLSLSMSLLVLKIRERDEVLTAREATRELLHDASEGLLGWDPIGPLKPHLGEPFRKLEQRLQACVGERYALPAWDTAAYRRTRRPIVSRRLLRPVTSSAGAARTCAMRSASSASLSRRILFRCPASNHGSRGRRALPRGCSCTVFSTSKPQSSCTKARAAIMPDPFEDLPDAPDSHDNWAAWETMTVNPSIDIIRNAWDAFARRLTPAQREAAMRPGSRRDDNGSERTASRNR
ncbi:MAG: hypothetical protein JO223_14105 [Hyphomicrobiales bacterium]|nr:hypothetical protein [Hyphomicrobiales bacterium]